MIKNGGRVFTDTLIGSHAVYTCNSGHVLADNRTNDTLICLHDIKWDKAPETCLGK